MIDEEIKLLLVDLLVYSRELVKFLESLKTAKYNAYLEELTVYAKCLEEDIQTIEHYIYELEIKLYDLLSKVN